MRLNGKTDIWFYGIIFIIAAVCVPILILSVFIEPNVFGAATSILVFVLTESLCLSIVIRNYVEFQDDALLIVFGFIKKRIPYEEITVLSFTREPWSSLAASLDRIKIRTEQKGDIMISVTDKSAFLREIQLRIPNVIVSTHKGAV